MALKTVTAASEPSIVPALQRGQYVAQGHRDRRGAEALQRHRLEFRGENADAAALEVGKLPDRLLGDHRRRRRHEQPGAMQAFFATQPKHELQHRGIGGEALPVRERIDQCRRRHHLETLVDPDEELRRNHRALNGAELHPLDLARDRAELARGVDLGLDAATGIPLDGGGVVLRELVRRIVDRRGGDLHHVGLVVPRARRTGHQQRRHDQRCDGGTTAQSNVDEAHGRPSRQVHTAILSPAGSGESAVCGRGRDRVAQLVVQSDQSRSSGVQVTAALNSAARTRATE
jgi:hypothetical protein